MTKNQNIGGDKFYKESMEFLLGITIVIYFSFLNYKEMLLAIG